MKATPEGNPIEDDTWTSFYLQVKDGWFCAWVGGEEISELAVRVPAGICFFKEFLSAHWSYRD